MSKACGLVTSCTRCSPTNSCVCPLDSVLTACAFQTLWKRVGIAERLEYHPEPLEYRDELVQPTCRVSKSVRRHHARGGLRPLRAGTAAADRRVERSLPAALFHGGHRPSEPGDALSARGVSLSA